MTQHNREERGERLVTVFSDTVRQVTRTGLSHECLFAQWDGASVFTELAGAGDPCGVPGTVGPGRPPPFSRDDRVPTESRVWVSVDCSRPGDDVRCKAYVRLVDEWTEAELSVVPLRSELHSRSQGLLETEAISGLTVLIVAVGSVGSYTTTLLAQSGVDRLILVDYDRLEVCNVVRHEADVSQVGRFKTRFQADRIRGKNPSAEVRTYEVKIGSLTLGLLKSLVRESVLVVCSTDDREGKLLVNRACVETGKPLIVAGAFRRAYGGQVLRIRPGETLCYQCFLRMLPTPETEQFRPDFSDCPPVAYSDRPVPIEPGLSVDIAPVCHMAAKLAIQELLQGRETTLRSLDEDLSAAWYLWVNRREADSPYGQLDPLGCHVDGMRILRWYGVHAPPDPECPACGEFGEALARREGVELSDSGLEEAKRLIAHLEGEE